MKQFSFRLEQVRKWRQDQAEVEELRLEQLFNLLRSIEAEQLEIAATADSSRREVLEKSSITSDELRLMESILDFTRHALKRLKGEEQKAKASVEVQRRRVLEAHRSFQLLDGLRDKALLTWTAQRDKEQEELGAELYLGKLARKSNAKSMAGN